MTPIVDKAVVKHALRLLGRSRKNLRKGRTLFDKTISASAQNNLGNQINNQCICCTIRECTLRNPSCDWQNGVWLSNIFRAASRNETSRCRYTCPSRSTFMVHKVISFLILRGTMRSEHDMNNAQHNFRTVRHLAILFICMLRFCFCQPGPQHHWNIFFFRAFFSHKLWANLRPTKW